MEDIRVETTSNSHYDTQRIGRVLGAYARPGQILLLEGELGAGKTCLTQGILWGLGGDEYARSPSFVLVAQYPARLTMYHIDLYRITSDEAVDLGLEEYLYGDGLSVVEWAERAPDLFPVEHLKVEIQHLGETDRNLTLSSAAPSYAEVLEAVRSSVARQ